MELVVEGAVAAGHRVRVVTMTPANGHSERGYVTIRRPSFRELLASFWWAEIVLMGGLSLRGLLLLSFLRKPVVVSHQSWYFNPGRRPGFKGLAKLYACRFVHNVCASKAIASALRVPSKVIPDAFRSAIFHPREGIARDRDLIFVGRLVSDKGVDLLLRAVKALEERGLRPTLTIIGDGVERHALDALCANLPLQSRPNFAGWKTPAQTAELLCRHRILVVPSRWQEPFGIVALEGIACGCAVVGSSGGGLPEAIGPCGSLFANGDATALADALQALLTDSARRESLAANAPRHLPRFQEASLVRDYLCLLDSIHGCREGKRRLASR